MGRALDFPNLKDIGARLRHDPGETENETATRNLALDKRNRHRGFYLILALQKVRVTREGIF